MSEATKAKLLELEKEYARTQKNKATEGHLGLVKAKIAKVRQFLSFWRGEGILLDLCIICAQK